MSKLKALIFDVDGTMADTERHGHRVAFNLAFADTDLDWHWSEQRYGELLTVTGGKERIRRYIRESEPKFEQYQDLDLLIASLHRRKTEYYVELLAQGGIPLRTGVQHLVEEASSADITLAIATTTTPANVDALLQATLGAGGKDYFSVIAAGDIVAQKKPAPDIYSYALEELGLQAEECLALEDSDNGLRSSLGAGIATLVTINGYTRMQNMEGAVAVIDQLGDNDTPANVLQGSLAGTYVDLAEIKRLHTIGHRS